MLPPLRFAIPKKGQLGLYGQDCMANIETGRRGRGGDGGSEAPSGSSGKGQNPRMGQTRGRAWGVGRESASPPWTQKWGPRPAHPKRSVPA